VNGDIVALRHNETRLRPEVSRKVSQERLDRSGAVRNLRVVLLIVFAEQAVENGGISIDENALDPRQNQCLVGIHVGSFCVRRGGVPASAQHLLDDGVANFYGDNPNGSTQLVPVIPGKDPSFRTTADEPPVPTLRHRFPSTLLLTNVVDRLLGKGRLM